MTTAPSHYHRDENGAAIAHTFRGPSEWSTRTSESRPDTRTYAFSRSTGRLIRKRSGTVGGDHRLVKPGLCRNTPVRRFPRCLHGSPVVETSRSLSCPPWIGLIQGSHRPTHRQSESRVSFSLRPLGAP